jgi:hypothetical protein
MRQQVRENITVNLSVEAEMLIRDARRNSGSSCNEFELADPVVEDLNSMGI